VVQILQFFVRHVIANTTSVDCGTRNMAVSGVRATTRELTDQSAQRLATTQGPVLAQRLIEGYEPTVALTGRNTATPRSPISAVITKVRGPIGPPTPWATGYGKIPRFDVGEEREEVSPRHVFVHDLYQVQSGTYTCAAASRRYGLGARPGANRRSKDLTMPASGGTDVRPPPLHSELTVYDLSAAGDEVWAVGRASFPGPALIAHTAGGQPWQ
jgi:hypothetical protein